LTFSFQKCAQMPECPEGRAGGVIE
jgi:hypothetical protein